MAAGRDFTWIGALENLRDSYGALSSMAQNINTQYTNNAVQSLSLIKFYSALANTWNINLKVFNGLTEQELDDLANANLTTPIANFGQQFTAVKAAGNALRLNIETKINAETDLLTLSLNGQVQTWRVYTAAEVNGLDTLLNNLITAADLTGT